MIKFCIMIFKIIILFLLKNITVRIFSQKHQIIKEEIFQQFCSLIMRTIIYRLQKWNLKRMVLRNKLAWVSKVKLIFRLCKSIPISLNRFILKSYQLWRKFKMFKINLPSILHRAHQKLKYNFKIFSIMK